MDTELWSEEPTPSASRHGSQDGELTEITKESWEVGFIFDFMFVFGLTELVDVVTTQELLKVTSSVCRLQQPSVYFRADWRR